MSKAGDIVAMLLVFSAIVAPFPIFYFAVRWFTTTAVHRLICIGLRREKMAAKTTWKPLDDINAKIVHLSRQWEDQCSSTL